MKLSTLRPLNEGIYSDFNRYIETDSEKAFGLLYDFIESNCGPYLNDRGGMMGALLGRALYRGMRGKKRIEILSPKTDRQPRDTPLPVHNAIVAAIEESGGIANRNNSFFTTEMRTEATGYGEAFVVLPIGNYHSTYLRGVNDLTLKYQSWLRDVDFHDRLRDEADMALFNFFNILEYPNYISNYPNVTPEVISKLEEEMIAIFTEKIRSIIVVDDLSDDIDDEEVLIEADEVLFISVDISDELSDYIKKRESST